MKRDKNIVKKIQIIIFEDKWLIFGVKIFFKVNLFLYNTYNEGIENIFDLFKAINDKNIDFCYYSYVFSSSALFLR